MKCDYVYAEKQCQEEAKFQCKICSLKYCRECAEAHESMFFGDTTFKLDQSLYFNSILKEIK